MDAVLDEVMKTHDELDAVECPSTIKAKLLPIQARLLKLYRKLAQGDAKPEPHPQQALPFTTDAA